MTGYSWVSITALLCYLFLFLTFLTAKKNTKVIRAFMMLLVIMILWAGGSFAMRAQLWPEVNLWHHISLLGMFLLAAGYFNFIAAFLEESNSNAGYIWGVFYIALFVFNSITGLFIPEPVVIYNDGAAQFVYNYSWHIYILLA